MGFLSGIIGTGLSVVATPLGILDDVLHGDASLSSTRECVGSALNGAEETIESIF